MKEQFVTYEIALALKELGFDEECLACYTPHLGHGIFELISKGSSNEKSAFNERFIKAGANNGCSAPLWQQAIDFLWLEKGILVNRNLSSEGTMYWQCGYNVFTEDELELAILKAIELCQK